MQRLNLKKLSRAFLIAYSIDSNIFSGHLGQFFSTFFARDI